MPDRDLIPSLHFDVTPDEGSSCWRCIIGCAVIAAVFVVVGWLVFR